MARVALTTRRHARVQGVVQWRYGQSAGRALPLRHAFHCANLMAQWERSLQGNDLRPENTPLRQPFSNTPRTPRQPDPCTAGKDSPRKPVQDNYFGAGVLSPRMPSTYVILTQDRLAQACIHSTSCVAHRDEVPMSLSEELEAMVVANAPSAILLDFVEEHGHDPALLAYQADRARGVLRWTSPTLDASFVLVPAGSAWLGGEGGKPGTKKVTIGHPFYLGV